MIRHLRRSPFVVPFLPLLFLLLLCCCWWPQAASAIKWTGGPSRRATTEEQQNQTTNWEEDLDGQIVIDEPAHYRLERYLMANYNNRLIPRRKAKQAIKVLFTIGLYQIIEVNEPQQYILLNSWIVERWKDELLYWDVDHFEGIREIVLPRESVWIPDTTLYNSLVMDDAESRRILNVKVNTLPGDKSALVEMLYPTLYQFSCMLDLRFFPFDIQHCVMTFGSWTHDNKNIDYFAYDDTADKIVPTLMGNGSGEQGPTRGGIGIEHCIPNEGWNILSTDVSRREVKFHCCENNYTLLEFKLHIQRKPLFYLVNLIIPTSIITLIAIVGFFSSSTVNDAREEKISLGITTLLSMSILIFMVSDQMPSTSSFIPLIGWFYTSMMGLISGGTLAASFVIYVQKKGIIGQRPARGTMRWARLLGRLIWMEMPLLMKQAYAIKAKQDKLQKLRQQWEQQLQKRQQSSANAAGTPPRRPTWWQQKWQNAKSSSQDQQGAVFRDRSGTGGQMATALGRYRSEAAAANGRLAGGTPVSTSFVGPTLGNAMAFLVPAGKNRKGKETSPPQPKVSTADSLAGSMSVSFLEAPAQTHSYNTNSINEEDSDALSQCSRSTGRDMGEEPKTPVTREGSESLNLIDMDDEETIKGEPADAAAPAATNQRKKGSVTLPEAAPFGQQNESANGTQANIVNNEQQQPIGQQEKQTAGRAHQPMNLTNPLVANAAVLTPVNQFAHSMLQRVQQRERERILSEVEARRRATTHKTSMFHRSASSMADLYAATLFPPTPSESVLGATGLDTSATLAEASANLAALHPQVQRNLAEIEYDWLAAVLERLFLILFSSLFFLMSLGINGIGLYYWYFTYVDLVEKS